MNHTTANLADGYLQLQVSEKLALVTAIWDSIAADSAETQAAISLDPAEIAELDRRLAQHQQAPETAIAWEEVRSKLFAEAV